MTSNCPLLSDGVQFKATFLQLEMRSLNCVHHLEEFRNAQFPPTWTTTSTMQKTQRKWNEENFDYLGNGRKTEMIKLVDGDEEDEERKKVFVHN